MDRFPPIKSQAQIDREARRQRTKEFITDFASVVVLLAIAVGLMTVPNWLPLIP